MNSITQTSIVFGHKISYLGILNKNPIQDLGLLFLLIPIWWIFGVESIILPIGCFLIFIKLLAIQQGKLQFPISMKWMSGFLIIYGISGVFIVESFRWITFFRNLSVFITAFLIAMIIVNSVKDWLEVRYLIKIVVILAGIFSIFGIFGIINVWRPNIISLLGKMLPEWIASTNYGKTIVFRKFGNLAYYQLVGYYFRVKSLFSYSILYASALAFIIPVVYYYHQIIRNKFVRFLVKLIIACLIINLIFTTGRIAIFGLAVGWLYYAFFVSRKTRSIRIPVVLLFSLLLVLLMMISFIDIEALLSIEEFSDVSYFLLYGRGASTSQRIFVYQETIAGWLDRPIFGWGTERDIPDFKYPAGSHSFYFGLLYRQGILGLFAFTMVMYSLWRTTSPSKISSNQDHEFLLLNRFLEIGRWVFIVAILDAITTDPILDILTMSVLWLIFSTLIAAKQINSIKWRKQLFPRTV